MLTLPGRTLEEVDTMYIMHIDPRKSSKWVAPPPEQLITTERMVRGDAAGTGADLEAHHTGASARAKETAVGPTTDHAE